jgi:transposase
MGLHPSAAPASRLHRATGADGRRTIEGILYILITGCRWQDLPREYGRPPGPPKQRPEKLVADRGYDTYASVNPGNSERKLVHKTREIFPRHEAWDIVMFREGGLLFKTSEE